MGPALRAKSRRGHEAKQVPARFMVVRGREDTMSNLPLRVFWLSLPNFLSSAQPNSKIRVFPLTPSSTMPRAPHSAMDRTRVLEGHRAGIDWMLVAEHNGSSATVAHRIVDSGREEPSPRGGVAKR
ncbi:hypothetical protein PHYPSEUDO_007589 [Phytophthora pseudosyringae]|uniref:Uncharacterized protein n=1 Tax=Phytophthora pseudosyringae TaxID=221518 RepID=A0A8T1VJD1_9STRA|nr:hypothetical protein PHYPSEUDO_007589 [Phytophthora pseudosyringae]